MYVIGQFCLYFCNIFIQITYVKVPPIEAFINFVLPAFFTTHRVHLLFIFMQQIVKLIIYLHHEKKMFILCLYIYIFIFVQFFQFFDLDNSLK